MMKNTFLVNPFHLKLLVNEEPLILNPREEEYTQLGIETESFNPTKLIRYLSSKYEEKFWLKTPDLIRCD